MVTHDFLINDGFKFRQYEDSPKDSYAGAYTKMISGDDFLLVTLDKFTEKENDFTDIVIYASYKGQNIKFRRHLSPLSKDMFNEVIKLVTI